jgi:acyl-CoA reductase-like NAD-dependent aldehyde dehydrogenase
MADALQNHIDGEWADDLRGPATVVPGYKQSGIRRELGKEGVEDFLEKKSVYVHLP